MMLSVGTAVTSVRLVNRLIRAWYRSVPPKGQPDFSEPPLKDEGNHSMLARRHELPCLHRRLRVP